MPQCKLPRVEHLPLGRWFEALVESGFTVGAISYDWAAERSHVNSNLVRAPRLDAADDYRSVRRLASRRRRDLPVCYGDLSVLLDDCHSFAVHGVSTDKVFNPARVEARATVDYRKICLLYVCVRRERLGESFHRLLRLRDDDEPRSVLVEPVDDSWARDAADSGERGAVVEKGVDERS